MSGRLFAVVSGFLVVCFMWTASIMAQPMGHVSRMEVRVDALPRAPIINEIAPIGSEDSPAWIELYNPYDTEVRVAGLVLGFDVSTEVELPQTIPGMPEGGFLQIVLDGEGSHATVEFVPDPTNHVGPGIPVVHLPEELTSAWRPNRGLLALYAPTPFASERTVLVDFVAWGSPPRGGWSRRDLGGLWPVSGSIPLVENAGLNDPQNKLRPGQSIGRLPLLTSRGPSSWFAYSLDERTPRDHNSLPAPQFFTPPSGTAVRQDDLLISWRGRTPDEKYRIEFATDRHFSDIVYEDDNLEESFVDIDTPFDPGQYYYRVRRVATGGTSGNLESMWSKVGSIQVLRTTCGQATPLNLATNSLLDGSNFRYQRKDTRLMCLGGCDVNRRDKAHSHREMRPGHRPRACGLVQTVPPADPAHGAENCARASISMLVSHYGKCLSQDRIAFFSNGSDADPLDDLGHGDPMDYIAFGWPVREIPPGGELSETLSWALGSPPLIDMAGPQPAVTDMIPSLPAEAIGFSHDTGWVEFPVLQKWIDSGRPMMTRWKKCETEGMYPACSAHARVIAGYCVDSDGKQWLYIFDPDAGPQWQTYSEWKISSEGLWVGPVMAPKARGDETSVWSDEDDAGTGDGLMEFDEVHRCMTDPSKTDSDADGTSDLKECTNQQN